MVGAWSTITNDAGARPHGSRPVTADSKTDNNDGGDYGSDIDEEDDKKRLSDGSDDGGVTATMAMSSRIAELVIQIKALIKLNRDKNHQIGVMGTEKSGKSTTMCALFGSAIVPTDVIRCTMIPTEVHSTVGNTKLEAKVYLRNSTEFEQALSRASLADIKEDKKETIDPTTGAPLTLEQWKNEIRKKCRKYIDHSSPLVLPEPPTPAQTAAAKDAGKVLVMNIDAQIKKWVTSRELSYVAKNMEIVTTLDGIALDAIIHDLPGFNSPLPEHKQMTDKALNTCEAFIICYNGTTPTPTNDPLLLINKIRELPEVQAKTFVYITRTDEQHTQSERDRCINEAREAFINYGFNSNHIFAVCPRVHALEAISKRGALSVEQKEQFRVYRSMNNATINKSFAIARDAVRTCIIPIIIIIIIIIAFIHIYCP
jgi:hypothetical protein